MPAPAGTHPVTAICMGNITIPLFDYISPVSLNGHNHGFIQFGDIPAMYGDGPSWISGNTLTGASVCGLLPNRTYQALVVSDAPGGDGPMPYPGADGRFYAWGELGKPGYIFGNPFSNTHGPLNVNMTPWAGGGAGNSYFHIYGFVFKVIGSDGCPYLVLFGQDSGDYLWGLSFFPMTRAGTPFRLPFYPPGPDGYGLLLSTKDQTIDPYTHTTWICASEGGSESETDTPNSIYIAEIRKLTFQQIQVYWSYVTYDTPQLWRQKSGPVYYAQPSSITKTPNGWIVLYDGEFQKLNHLLSRDGTKYWWLHWAPQTPQATNMIYASMIQRNLHVETACDANGYVYARTTWGDTSYVATSRALLLPGFSASITPAQAIPLPCYDPCFPVCVSRGY